MMKICSIPDCALPYYAKGLCNMHYTRERRKREPKKPHLRAANGAAMGFIQNVAMNCTDDECLIWPFARDADGYGHPVLCKGGVQIQPHRIVCMRVHGEPPTTKHEAAHSCNNGHLGCVNPRHLRWATHIENLADGRRTKILTIEDVVKIREIKGKMSLSKLSLIYGVTPSALCRIQNRKTYGWV